MKKRIAQNHDDLLEELADSIDIPSGTRQKTKERYTAIGKWLSRPESKVQLYAPKIYSQGSFKLGTVIRPFGDDEEYDIDLVCELKMSKNDTTRQKIKSLVGEEIIKYARGHNMQRPEEGGRCWVLQYADGEKFHIDILPAIPQGTPHQTAIWITDKEQKNWLSSNPKGYAEWFAAQQEARFESLRKTIAQQTRASIEEIPRHSVKTPLQRAIQLLKRHRDIMFETKNTENKPISIVITTLATRVYNNEATIKDALQSILENMAHEVDESGNPRIENPVDRNENFADKWAEYPEKKDAFFEWLEQANRDFKSYFSNRYLDVPDNFANALGEDFLGNAIGKFDGISRKNKTKLPILLENLSDVTADALPVFVAYKTSKFDHGLLENHIPKTLPHVEHQPKDTEGQTVRIKAKEINDTESKIFRELNSGSVIKKYSRIKFQAVTKIGIPFNSQQYKVEWQVVNTGEEAYKDEQLRGGFRTAEKDGTLIESTRYCGFHWVQAFVIRKRGDTCIGKSSHFFVPIAPINLIP